MNSLDGSALSMVTVMIMAATLAAAYFIGNISPAILIGKMAGIDIRTEGSGNAGTTNVLRVLGKKAAVGTLLIDIFKGVGAVALARLIAVCFLPWDVRDPFIMACTIAVFVGHIWPAIFGFRGGKGIATGFGAVVTLAPAVGVGLLIMAVLGIVVSRRVSVGSVLAAFSAPVLAYFFAPQYILGMAVMGLIAVYKHRANIARMLKGEEPKVNLKK